LETISNYNQEEIFPLTSMIPNLEKIIKGKMIKEKKKNKN